MKGEKEILFITLAKIRGKITPTFLEATQKALKAPPPGINIHNILWTLGQYDFVVIYEAPNEKEAMKMAIPWVEFCETQTMVAISNEEAQKMLK